MDYPWQRVRRLGRTPTLRTLVRSIRTTPEELVPYLRVAVDDPGRGAEALAERALASGHAAVFLAPSAKRRDAEGSEVWRPDAPLAHALTAARAATPELVLIAELDLALFHRSGRPAVVAEGLVDIDAAHDAIGKAGTTLGQAGADVIALRGQADGGVTALREALDESGLERVAILAFSGDLHSPFAELRPRSADKAADLLDPLDPGALIRQAESDVGEGADMLGVQPCLLAQDLLRELFDEHQLPIVARITEHEAKTYESAARSGIASLAEVAAAAHGSLLRAGARLVVTPWTWPEEGRR
jgi:porphobilinogen synthase